MPYVSCPSCEQVTFARPSRRGAELCARCGDLLPPTRRVVPLTRYRVAEGPWSKPPHSDHERAPAREVPPIAA
jgi:hypothetical protein